MNSGSPLVSIIVPAYNAARFIAATLESVLAQTHSHLEIWVADDGSVDETPQIVEGFARRDARVRWFRQENAGVGAARNAAIARAQGRYLATIDADDLWHPEKIATQVAEMERGGDRLGFVYCWSEVIDLQGRLIERCPPCTAAGWVLHRHVFRNFLHNASVPLFRATALAAVGGFATRAEQGGAQGCEDWDLTLRVAEEFEVGVVPQYLVSYRDVPSGMSSGGTGMAASFAYLQSGLRRRNPGLPQRLHLWAGGFFYLYLARKCHQGGRVRDALHYARLAVRIDPAVAIAPPFFRVLLGSGRRWFWPRSAAAPGGRKPFTAARSGGLSPWLWRIFSRIEDQRWTRLIAQEASR